MKVRPTSFKTTCNTRSLFIASSRMEFVFNQVISASGLVVELQRHGAVRGSSPGAQGSGQQGTFGHFLARSTHSLCGFYVHFDAVGALRRAGNSQRNEFAVFPGNG